MRRLIPVLAVLFLLASPAAAQDLMRPDPGLPPERVVEIQLRSLQHNDEPTPDAGIAQTWAFAHPDNKRMTGPFDRFAAMIKGPLYRMLIGHRQHIIEPLAETADRAIFTVTVIAASGDVVSYRWEVAKVQSGPQSGAWMTIRVSPPLPAEET